MWNENKTCSNGSCSTGMCHGKVMPIMIVMILLIGLWIYLYTSSNANESTIDKQMEISQKVEKSMDNSLNTKEGVVSMNWKYTDYSTSALKEAKWNIVLFFHANWCPTCIATDKDIISKWVPDNLTIFKTDFDTELELKKKYEVLTQTTFVQVDNQWNMIKKWVWGRLADIVEKVGEK